MTKKLGDPVIALTVVACSLVLFLALAFALLIILLFFRPYGLLGRPEIQKV